MIQEAENANLVIAAAGSKTAYTGLFINVLGWLMTTEALGLLGLFLTAVGVIINYYFKRKAHMLAAAEARGKERERELRMELMQQRGFIFPTTDTEMEDQDA